MEFTENKRVPVSMVGSDGYLSVIGHFQIVQDAITELFTLHKLDAPTLRHKYNAIWVFVKTKVKLIKRLRGHENFMLTAFFSYVSLAKIHIDVQLKNTDGETAAYARTEICALDIEKHGIRRLPSVGVDTTMATRSEDIEMAFDDFEEADLPLFESGIRVKSTSIDMSYHTNNVEYVRMIMSTYSVAETEAMSIKDMELQFAGQSYENDVLSIRKSVKENDHRVVLEKDGRPIVKCKIVC